MQFDQVEQSGSTQPPKKQKTMGRKNQGPEATASNGVNSKRARKQPVSKGSNERLLQNNPFSVLPENEQDDSAPVVKREKVPPLFTMTKEIGMLRDGLAKVQIYPLFKLCNMGIKIMCSTLLDYDNVKLALTEGKFQFYTHDIPSSKPLKVIIRGLNSLLESEIRAELERFQLKPLQIFSIRRKDQSGAYRDQLYLVHFAKGSTTLAALRQIRALFSLIVEWEPYRPRHRDVTQCMNCLSFGHGTRNCHMNARCGKCAGNHVTSECASVEEVKCANCGQQHQGSDRTCPKRAEFIKIRKDAAKKKQPGRSRAPPNNEENFPAIRHVVPNLAPLPLNNQPPSGSSSVHDRFRAAAESVPPPSSSSQPPPGLAGAWANPPNHRADESNLYSPEVIQEFSMNLFVRLMDCRCKQDQIRAALSVVSEFLSKYGP